MLSRRWHPSAQPEPSPQGHWDRAFTDLSFSSRCPFGFPVIIHLFNTHLLGACLAVGTLSSSMTSDSWLTKSCPPLLTSQGVMIEMDGGSKMKWVGGRRGASTDTSNWEKTGKLADFSKAVKDGQHYVKWNKPDTKDQMFLRFHLSEVPRLIREKARAPHSSTLAWKIPWTEKPGGLQSTIAESDTTERLHFHFQKPEQWNSPKESS